MKFTWKHLDYAYYRGYMDCFQMFRGGAKLKEPRIKLGGYSWFLKKVLRWPDSPAKREALKEAGIDAKKA